MSGKLREALEQIHNLLSIGGKPDTAMCIRYEAAFQIAKEALTEPIRNCDVGTADEQMKRQHDTMCNTTKACPDSDWSCKKCFAEWAQMPYKEQKKIN